MSTRGPVAATLARHQQLTICVIEGSGSIARYTSSEAGGLRRVVGPFHGHFQERRVRKRRYSDTGRRMRCKPWPPCLKKEHSLMCDRDQDAQFSADGQLARRRQELH